MSSSASLAGRRIWIAGIGGAGMSGYALLAHAWGAEVAGWDRVETPYLRNLDGVAVEISPVWSSFSYFVLLIAILIVRPQGLFGVRERTL